jgi:hypothetical protein
MPKEKASKKSAQLRHTPLGTELEKPMGKLKPPRRERADDDEIDAEEQLPKSLGNKIFAQAREQQIEMSGSSSHAEKNAPADKRKVKAGAADSDGFEVQSAHGVSFAFISFAHVVCNYFLSWTSIMTICHHT